LNIRITSILVLLLLQVCILTSCWPHMTFVMKGVDINIPLNDYVEMKVSGIKILTTEWGMERDPMAVEKFLDRAHAAGLKVVLDGGFSYTACGFTDDDWEELPRDKYPVWQKERVQKWIGALKDHPAVYAWDICNEFGENIPSGSHSKNSQWPDTRITLKQLLQSRADVLEMDPDKPLLVRMYSWDLEGIHSLNNEVIRAGIADIVMLNFYSNQMVGGKLTWPTAIIDSAQDHVNMVKKLAPDAEVWVAVATFEQSGVFQKPTEESLSRDIKDVLALENIDGVAFFAWGPIPGWDPENDWYLPETGADLWRVIKKSIKESEAAQRAELGNK
jgi:hypothetical protein